MPKNMLVEQVDKFWFSRQRQITEAAQEMIDGNPTPLRSILAGRFEDGARWNFRETSAASPYIAKFLEMCILLGGPTGEELASAYWRSEGATATQTGTTGDTCQSR